ncbi:MAG: trypsin-like peptidase domain-containing protein [Reichenbachiella sp.]
MKNLSILIFSLIIAIQGQSQSLAEHYSNLSKSVVKIIVEGQEIEKSTMQKVTSQGLGSGVLISEEGLIVTASHVIQTANSVKVQFIDGEVIPAKVISSAPFADVATIQLSWKPKDKVVAKLGNSDETKIGDQIFMIGAPYGLEFSLSVGYISGRHKKKRFAHGEQWMEFFQTDAAINQGNSGGPMFNMKGEIVGIASYILSESGGFQGLGFAATSNVCKELLLDERNAWSGIEGVFITGELANALNVSQGAGLLIQKVAMLSPFGIVGIQGGTIPVDILGETILIGGDVIIAVNKTPLTDEINFEKIRIELEELEPGDTYSVTVLRDGRKEKIKATAE